MKIRANKATPFKSPLKFDLSNFIGDLFGWTDNSTESKLDEDIASLRGSTLTNAYKDLQNPMAG